MPNTLKIFNPATEKLIREVEADSPDTVAKKYTAAKTAQKKWAGTPVESRVAIIKKFRDSLVTKKEELSQILTSEVGKPITQSRNELGGVLARIDFFLEKTAQTLKPETVFDDGKMVEKISQEPLGVIANISAWNYPYLVGSNVFIPALLTGNAVLYKPSEFSTLTGLAITDLLYSAGIPEDVFIPVIGDGKIGAALLDQPINGVYFTGSYATGQKIAEVAAKKLIRVQLELGGKDPAYVCEDANVKNAAESLADGAFYNNGQSCCSVERIYVHEKIYDQFVKDFMATVNGFVMGDPLDDKTYIGALARGAQIEILQHQVRDAEKKGAKKLAGGNPLTKSGYFFEPTVFIDVNHTMELMREESFGPIIGIQKVKNDSEAIHMMNDTSYGLTAGVYTPNKSRAEEILSEVNAGSAYWNCCDRVSPRLPWSGRQHSGLGATLSTAGILAFTQPKGWHLRQT